MANDYKILYLIQNGEYMNIYPKLKQMGLEDIRCYRKAFLAFRSGGVEKLIVFF